VGTTIWWFAVRSEEPPLAAGNPGQDTAAAEKKAANHKLMTEKIRLTNAMATDFELLATRPADDEIKTIHARLEKCNRELRETIQSFDRLPFSESKAIKEEYQAEMAQAEMRLRKAMAAAAPAKTKEEPKNTDKD